MSMVTDGSTGLGYAGDIFPPLPMSYPVYPWPQQQQTFTIGPDLGALEQRIAALESEIAELKRARRPKRRRR